MQFKRSMTIFLVSLCFFLNAFATLAETQMTVSSGKLIAIKAFQSNFINERQVMIWLPDGYSKSKKYSVLYMHDGQMLFDASTTWNQQEWGVDETAGQLQKMQQTKPFIVVGVFNGDSLRYPEYLPQKPWDALSEEQQRYVAGFAEIPEKSLPENFIRSDNYLKFLVKELKPYIDKHYSVHTDKANTFVAGSSMGGLISMYAIGEYPEIFGGAACISTHWPGSSVLEWTPMTDQLLNYLKTSVPAPSKHRIYFDYGDQTLDALYPPMQKAADQIMHEKGYNQSNWRTVYAKGAAHDEASWRARLHRPIRFLLSEKK